jgi:exosortase
MQWRIVRFIALALLVGSAYSYTGYWLYVRWSAPESFFAHGYLIPLVFLWLLYRRRFVLKETEPQPDLRGLLLICPALLLHLSAVYLEVYSPSGFTLPILMGGLVLYFWGRRAFRILLFPLFFLFFAIPLPMNWVHEASFRLKMIAMDLSTGLAVFLGTELKEVGAKIIFPSGDSLMVGTPCSGLRSLIAMVALGVLYAVEFTRMNFLGRMMLVVLIIPIAMISNVLRVTFLCLVAGRFGSAAAAGQVHDLSGYSLYIVGLLLMLAMGRLLMVCPLFVRRASCKAVC